MMGPFEEKKYFISIEIIYIEIGFLFLLYFKNDSFTCVY